MDIELLGSIEETRLLGPAHISIPRMEKVDPALLNVTSNLAKDFFEQTGEPLQITDSFRTNEEQAELYKRKPNLAVPPGKSKHEIGGALDVAQEQISKFGLDNWSALLNKHGLVRPALSKGEVWHIELPRFEQAQKIAAETSKVKLLGPVEETGVELLGPTGPETTFPSEKATPEQAVVERAKIENVAGTGTETEPVYFNPPLMVGGLASIGRSAAGSLLGALGKTGLTTMAKAIPGFLVGETGGAAALEALDQTTNIPESLKIPLSMVGAVAGGLATSKLGQLGAGAKLRISGGKVPMPSDEVIATELTNRLNRGLSAQDALKEIAAKYEQSVPDLLSVPASPGIKLGSSTPIAPKSPLDSSELGAPIVTRQITTAHDSTLGPTGTVVDTLPLNEGHVAMREAFSKPGVDIIKPRVMDWKNTFKTNERVFSELDDIAPGFQDEFWGKLKASENIAHDNTKIIFQEVDDIAKQVGKGAGDKIGIDLISKRRSGIERLNAMGITPKPLTVVERQVANDFQIKFHDTLVRINEARALAGKQPIKEDANYVTFMSNFINKVAEGANPIEAQVSVFAIPQTTPFKFEKAMSGGEAAIETDLFKVFKNYSALAERHINISPHLEKIRKFIGPMELPDGTKIPALAVQAPNAAVALAEMASTISGVKPPMSTAARLLTKASDNLVISTLGAYPKSVLNQTGSLAAGAAEVGPINLVKGLMDVLKPGSLKYAAATSDVLAQRKMDVVLEELGASWIKSFSGSAKHYAMLPLEIVDNLMAHGVWNGAMRKAAQMGMTEQMAQRFADKVVVRTQASASPIDRAMIQRSPLGKVLTAFQTFSIADANYIARSILGQGNINFSSIDGVKKLAKMTAVGLGLNYLQRDVLGIPPGLPEPFYAMGKAREEGAGLASTTWEGAKEFAPFLPVIGSIAYGKTPFGAVGSLITDLVGGNKSPMEALAMLAGVPGMNMMIKGLKTPSGRELLGDLENKTGLPIGPRTKLLGPLLTAKDIMFGRDQSPRKHKPTRSDEFLRGLTGGD